MAAVRNQFKRLFLRGILWDAQDGGLALFDALKASARGRLTDTKTGRTIVGTSSNGNSVQFAIPAQGKGLDSYSIAELCGELLDMYEIAKADLITAGTASPTDAQIHTEMMDRLQQVTQYGTDQTGLRFR